jgi:hypothetical protein
MDGTLRIVKNGQEYHLAFIPEGAQVATPGHICSSDLDYVLSDIKVEPAAQAKLLKAVDRPGGVTMSVTGLSELNLRAYQLIL